MRYIKGQHDLPFRENTSVSPPSSSSLDSLLKMKLFTTALLFAAAPTALASAVPQLERKMTYDGYKVFRISTHHNPAAIKSKISKFAAIPFNLDNNEHLDVA